MTSDPQATDTVTIRQPAGGTRKVVTRILLVLATLVCLSQTVLMAFVFFLSLRDQPGIDDAYAFCRYADHFLAGEGLAWNPGSPPTYGCTSLLYLFWIIVLKIALLWPCAPTLAIGSWLPAVLMIVVLGFACVRYARSAPLNHWLIGLGFVSLCTALPPAFYYHAANGMDTTLGMLTNALVVLAVAHPRFGVAPKRTIAAAIFAYLAFLARPESLAYVTLFPALVLLLGASQSRHRWKTLLLFGGCLLVLIAIDSVAKAYVFGNPLPLPFFAKRAGYYEGYIGDWMWNPFNYTRFYLLAMSLPLLLVVCLTGHRSWRFVAACLIPCALVFCYLGTVRQIMGHQARFYFPSLPFLIIAAYAALDGAVAQLRWPGIKQIAMRTAAVLAAIIVVVPVGARVSAWYEQKLLTEPSLYQDGLYEPDFLVEPVGWHDSANAVLKMVLLCPMEALWTMTEHGQIGAYAPGVRIIDLAGLHDRTTLTGKSIIDHMLDERPDVIWFPHYHYTGMVHKLRTCPILADEYEYWPTAFDHGLAVRKSSPFHAEIRAVLEHVWTETYGTPLPPPSVRVR